MGSIYAKLKNELRDGLFYILLGGLFTKVVGFLSSVLVIRFLPKLDYGNYVSANNLYSYLAVFIGMGFAPAILQFCSMAGDGEKKRIYCFTLRRGTAFNFLLSVVVMVLAAIRWKSSAEVGQYLAMMSCIPFFSYFSSYFQIILRIKNLNREYSYVGMADAASMLMVNLVFSRVIGVVSLVLSQYVACIISAVLSVYFLKRAGEYDIPFASGELERSTKREVEQYALLGAVTNFTSNILVLIDITCLDMMTSDPQLLAGYKVANTIPSALLFIPSSMIVYYYPKLVRLYSENLKEFKGEIRVIRRTLMGVSGIIAVGMFIFAPLIINIVFGEQYGESVGLFRVLCLNFFIFSSLRKLYGNAMAIIKKINVNLINTTLSGVLNIVLNIILINTYGAMGAAIATIIVSVFTTAFSVIFFQLFLKREMKR